MNLGNVELFTQVTREQSTRHQLTDEFTNTPNSDNVMNIPHESYRK